MGLGTGTEGLPEHNCDYHFYTSLKKEFINVLNHKPDTRNPIWVILMRTW
jgi:hypothetical protein